MISHNYLILQLLLLLEILKRLPLMTLLKMLIVARIHQILMRNNALSLKPKSSELYRHVWLSHWNCDAFIISLIDELFGIYGNGSESVWLVFCIFLHWNQSFVSILAFNGIILFIFYTLVSPNNINTIHGCIYHKNIMITIIIFLLFGIISS